MQTISKTEELKVQLRKSFLFCGGAEECADYAVSSPQSELKVFSAGEAIYSVTKYHRAVAFLVCGKAAAFAANSGGAPVTLNAFSAGAMFGLAAVFVQSGEYVTNVVAQKPCTVLFLPQQLLSELFAQNLCVAERYIAFLSDRVEYLNRKIAGFTAGEAENRLAFYLCSLVQEQQTEALVLPCTVNSLCTILNIGRASLYRAFDSLTECGAIQHSGKSVCVLSRERLQAACQKRKEV